VAADGTGILVSAVDSHDVRGDGVQAFAGAGEAAAYRGGNRGVQRAAAPVGDSWHRLCRFVRGRIGGEPLVYSVGQPARVHAVRDLSGDRGDHRLDSRDADSRPITRLRPRSLFSCMALNSRYAKRDRITSGDAMQRRRPSRAFFIIWGSR